MAKGFILEIRDVSISISKNPRKGAPECTLLIFIPDHGYFLAVVFLWINVAN